MSIKKRLDLVVKELGLSGRAFEKECGLANGSYSSIRDGVGADKLNKILIRYPQVSAGLSRLAHQRRGRNDEIGEKFNFDGQFWLGFCG